MRRAIHRFASLPPARRYLLLEALAYVSYCRLLLGLLPLRRVLRLTVDRRGAPSPAGGRVDPARAREVDWAVAVAARSLPYRATCLTRSLAQGLMLRRRGLAGTFVIGVRNDEETGFRAHAWIVAGNRDEAGTASADWRILARYRIG